VIRRDYEPGTEHLKNKSKRAPLKEKGAVPAKDLMNERAQQGGVKPLSGRGLRDGLAADGRGYGVFARIDGMSWCGRMRGDGFGGGEKRVCLDVGNGPTACKGDADVGGSDVVWEFGDGEHVKSSGGEECGLDLSTKPFDGSANGFKAIFGILENAEPGIGSKTDLMAKVGHSASQFSGGRGFGGFFKTGPGGRVCQEKSEG
jgi:hypothetical protein